MTAWEVLAILFIFVMAGAMGWLAFWFEQERREEEDDE